MIELRCPGWTSGPVVGATRFWQRFRGINAVPPDSGVLISTRSVHTIGLRGPVGVVALSATRRVLAASWIPPKRVVAVPGAVEYLELPPGRSLPPVGEQLAVRTSTGPIVSG